MFISHTYSTIVYIYIYTRLLSYVLPFYIIFLKDHFIHISPIISFSTALPPYPSFAPSVAPRRFPTIRGHVVPILELLLPIQVAHPTSKSKRLYEKIVSPSSKVQNQKRQAGVLLFHSFFGKESSTKYWMCLEHMWKSELTKHANKSRLTYWKSDESGFLTRLTSTFKDDNSDKHTGLSAASLQIKLHVGFITHLIDCLPIMRSHI